MTKCPHCNKDLYKPAGDDMYIDYILEPIREVIRDYEKDKAVSGDFISVCIEVLERAE